MFDGIVSLWCIRFRFSIKRYKAIDSESKIMFFDKNIQILYCVSIDD